MSDVASLEIRVGSDGVVTAENRLKGLAATGATAERATDSLGAGFRRLVGPMLAVGGAVAAFSKFIEVNREFDKLNAGLITATGSAEGAKQAFGALEQFAAQTPYSLRETTDGFVKLVNYGLQPSERALRSYGNTSSALGKGLGQMIEAVADATTGEFERLKEFGIKSKQEGDKVTFTFRGVSTTVGKSSKEIQDYLINLGETNFSDAMANRMDTLDGKLSNLGDSWDRLFRNIGSTPIGDIIKEGVDTAIAALDALKEAMESDFSIGISAGLRTFAAEAKAAYEIIQGTIRGDKKRIDDAIRLADEKERQIALAAKQTEFDRENTQALIDFGIEVDKNTDRLKKFAKASDLLELSSFNQAMADANAKFAEDEAKRREQEAKAKAKRDRDEFRGIQDKFRTEEEITEQSFQRRQALINRYSKGEQWTRLSSANVDMYTEELTKIREARDKDLNDIRESMRDQEAVLRESYEKRRKIVLGSDADDRDSLLSAMDQKEADRRYAIADEKRKDRERERESLFSEYRTEEETIRASEQKKLEAYREALEERQITEAEYATLRQKLYAKTSADLAEVDMRTKEQILGSSSDLFGGLAQTTKNLGGSQSATYKGLFAMSKAFSVAQATMSIATGTAKALELGWPAGLAAGLQVAAQGAMLLATITGSNYSGAYDRGGIIPAGSIGLVGERGPELVQGPAMVTSRQQTEAIMRDASQPSGPSGQPINLRIINAPDPAAAHQYNTSSAGEATFTNYIRRNAVTIKQILG